MAAARVVSALGGEGRVEGETVRLQIGDLLAEDVVRRLVEEGVRVRALVPERAGLEDVYLSLVEGS